LNAASRTVLFETIEVAIGNAAGSIDVTYDAVRCMFRPASQS
jgi:hypothetical protein